MKKLIKIKRSSIKRNPQAYVENYHLPGSIDVSGTYQGELPKNLKDKVLVTSITNYSDKEAEHDFTFITAVDKDILLLLSKDKNASFSVNVNYIDVQCGPQPEYLYEYTNPLLECSNCHGSVRLKDIQSDYVHDSDGDEHNVDKCPICNEIDTFDYEFESIKEAIKR